MKENELIKKEPELKERKGDIPILVKYFVDKFNNKLNITCFLQLHFLQY